ncbi:MAG: hypothetical protein QNJ06_08785 [Kiloniellales bacterium]|nr:hypothetical protein [Kiloniellales bacterium]
MVAAPDGLGNLFVRLRLGQAQFVLGQLDRSADELARAYMGGGSEIFEEEDPKYWDFIRSKLQPPT